MPASFDVRVILLPAVNVVEPVDEIIVAVGSGLTSTTIFEVPVQPERLAVTVYVVVAVGTTDVFGFKEPLLHANVLLLGVFATSTADCPRQTGELLLNEYEGKALTSTLIFEVLVHPDKVAVTV